MVRKPHYISPRTTAEVASDVSGFLVNEKSHHHECKGHILQGAWPSQRRKEVFAAFSSTIAFNSKNIIWKITISIPSKLDSFKIKINRKIANVKCTLRNHTCVV